VTNKGPSCGRLKEEMQNQKIKNKITQLCKTN